MAALWGSVIVRISRKRVGRYVADTGLFRMMAILRENNNNNNDLSL